MNEKVVFLAFNNSDTSLGARDLIACKCGNKAYALVHQGEEKFPLVECTACHSHLGQMGWVTE